MDAIVEGPQDDGAQELNLMDSAWANSQDPNNSTLLYIAVEYVKDYKLEANQQQGVFDFDQHVSPLDPNMSSVARYSPVYDEPQSDFNPVVIHQLVTPETEPQFVNNASTPVLNNMEEVETHYLAMVNENEPSPEAGLQVMPKNEEVELLITDQTTGISYSVSTQELLVEPCLDEQLLEALNPDPLLDTDLLALDENTLKTELQNEMIPSEISNQCVNQFIENVEEKQIETPFKMEMRSRQTLPEEQLLSCVYSITDKPVLSRARATLPETYLVINKIDEEEGVFAKKLISSRTQFGPLEGALVQPNDLKIEGSKLQLFVETEAGNLRMDISDENTSNWMCFVRKAETFEEQNLVLVQENNLLYFTTTRNILPKQELKVGYSTAYAEKYNLQCLVAKVELAWPCFECPLKFASSQDLQKHLNVHDIVKDENEKPKKKKLVKVKKRGLKKYHTEAIECDICNNIFTQYTNAVLKKHLVEEHNFDDKEACSIEQNFSIVLNYKCDHCDIGFKSERLLKIHNLEHNPDCCEEQINHVCPSCQRKFPTQRQLVLHVPSHALPKKITQTGKFKCPTCYKIFAFADRLQRHMLVHGSDDLKPLQCKTCNKRFLTNSALACHVKSHYQGLKVFECPICKESFDHVLYLKMHIPKHCINNEYTCPFCKKVFKKYSIIRKHIRAFHCERKHTCQHCSKMFASLDKLRKHLLRHSDHREFLCSDCGTQFKRKDKLREHCKRMHSEERENTVPKASKSVQAKKFTPKVEPTDFHRFIYKCHICLVGFKRRGMLVNHLAKRHPDISPDSVPELNLPILQTTRDYYCQYCDKVYKSSSKRKAHILKNHPGAALPMSNRKQGLQEVSGMPNPTFSQTVGSITTRPQSCQWCHKQYASKAKLLQHQRKKHPDNLVVVQRLQNPKPEGFDKEEVLAGFEGDQYCMMEGNEFMENGELENPNSHLYRLLTNNGMVPPR